MYYKVNKLLKLQLQTKFINPAGFGIYDLNDIQKNVTACVKISIE